MREILDFKGNHDNPANYVIFPVTPATGVQIPLGTPILSPSHPKCPGQSSGVLSHHTAFNKTVCPWLLVSGTPFPKRNPLATQNLRLRVDTTNLLKALLASHIGHDPVQDDQGHLSSLVPI